jgi:hypothetical protein
MQFQTSHLSPPSARLNPDSVTVSDHAGNEFIVHRDGSLVLKSSGRIWGPKDGDTYTTMLANLQDPSGNRALMDAVLGSDTMAAAVAKPRLPVAAPPPEAAPGGALDVQGAKEKGTVPLTKRPWFWPVVILGVTGVAGVAFMYWPRGEEGEHGEPVPA